MTELKTKNAKYTFSHKACLLYFARPYETSPLRRYICQNSLSMNAIVVRHFQDSPTTGRERLIRSHSSARFCFELSGNLN